LFFVRTAGYLDTQQQAGYLAHSSTTDFQQLGQSVAEETVSFMKSTPCNNDLKTTIIITIKGLGRM
jgi:hypothetical protein